MAYEQPPANECVNHPGYPVAGYCPRCGQALCLTCLEAHNQDPARYCPGPPAHLPATAPRNPLKTLLIVVSIVLCVCVVALLVGGIAYYHRSQAPPPVEVTNSLEEPPFPPGPTGPVAPLTPPAVGPPAVPLPPSGTDREQAARAVALQDKPGWVAVLNWHQADWSEVRVWIGPSKTDLRLSRALVWDPSLRAYVIMDEGPVTKPPSTTTPRPSVGGPQPNEQAALDAALANDPGYVARVALHSADWKKVTVVTGPPLKPLANEYRFHWDDDLKQYVLDHMGPVGKSGGQPEGE